MLICVAPCRLYCTTSWEKSSVLCQMYLWKREQCLPYCIMFFLIRRRLQTEFPEGNHFRKWQLCIREGYWKSCFIFFLWLLKYNYVLCIFIISNTSRCYILFSHAEKGYRTRRKCLMFQWPIGLASSSIVLNSVTVEALRQSCGCI